MMKKMITAAILLCFGTIAIAQKNQHKDLDKLIEHFQQSIKNDDQYTAASCFAPTVKTNMYSDSSETCTRSEFLENKDLEFLKQLKAYAKGFVYQSDGTYVNLQNIQYQNTGEISVKVNGLALRRAPDISSALIARLDQGIYSGYERDDGLITTDQENGITWVPVKVHLDGMGWVKGYVAQQYVDIESNQLFYEVTVSETNQGLRISQVNLVPRLSSSPLTSL
ncbi:MAG: hypothetical protein HRT74_10915 [Flavobacteriales bacterium]|nr:hypothetical protein [Flavobacteriales bacterium]